MWFAAIRDLVWRRRRYLISVVGTALVFALSLVMTGISSSFPAEIDGVFDHLGATGFVVPEGMSGPLSGTRPFDPSQLPEGVDAMAGLVQTVDGDKPLAVAVLGLAPGSPGLRVDEGRPPAAPGEIAVAAQAPWGVGDRIVVGGVPMTVTGRLPALSLNAGMPLVVTSLRAFQTAFFAGAALATAGVRRGPPGPVPDGFTAVSTGEARTDALRVLGGAVQTLQLTTVLLWVVAALVIGSVIFLTAVERTRDFAVFKAVGAGTWSLAGGVVLQGLVLALAATAVGAVIGLLLGPVFPMRVTITPRDVLMMPVVAVVIGLIAGLLGLRRAVRVDPALAFGGAA